MRSFSRLFACLLLLVAADSAFAQTGNPGNVITSGTSYHIFAQPGEPTIEVMVLGDTSTGIYVVGSSTSMLDLLALSGAGAAANNSRTSAAPISK